MTQHRLPLMVTIFLFLIIPFVAPLSFNFTNFSPDNPDIQYERAYAANNVIQLTTNLASIGRASYAKPLQLWDRASGKLTNFTTQFSFTIDSQNRSAYGDGIAFFLAPVGSRIPEGITKGGSLGLTRDDQPLNSTDNPFVAVEFDIYQNLWDPEHDHVGIDINSMRSVDNVTWLSSVLDGKQNHAWISYDSSLRNLSVVFTGFMGNSSVRQGLSHIVDLRDHLPEWVIFGFSSATGNASAVQSIQSWSFSSTLEIGEKTSKGNTGLVVGLAVGGGVLVCGLCGLVVFVYWKKRRENEDDPEFDEIMDEELERGTGPRKFSYAELARATSKFSQEEKLGEGGFGGVYRGFLRELNSYVAVKRISRGSKQGIKEFASEVRTISRLRHRNLVQLIGWCHEKRELLLVYEFMENGSLDSHLFKGKSMLTWAARYKIAQDLASALLYLHEEWEQCVVHRDIKSSNVLLDSNFNAKLGDFGLARLVDHEKGSQTTVLAGTMGYMAPECVITGRASKESDVFSFGVVAVEIACGRKPINHKAQESEINMVEWVWNLYGFGKLTEAADPKLCGDFNEQEMERLMIVGLWCAHPHSRSRPSNRQVIQTLNFEASVPILPSEMPVATYLAPSMNKSSLQPSNDGTSFGSSQIQSLNFTFNTDSSQLTESSAASSSTSSLLKTA
ncbi:Legume lectin domain protein [Actinidia chinensis var. chinensis]|uniref:Legume lectin domain protein n=1 Tax=Actinidia chinensis var. chinensis TaxID=1590841 RepID=A0A2R6Q5P0_ACTCC|nr:Legume lectin domain protein [Actinidia chinensis var. chinensis]